GLLSWLEKQSVIRLTLTAIDGGTPAKSGSMIIIVNVLDVNDNTPVFSQTLYKASVYENVKIGTSIITLNATDLDAGSNGQVFYSFSDVANDGASSPLTSHTKLLIEVLDVNDNAPEISVTSLLNTVKEDASVGTAIALVSVFDKDGGKNGMVHSKITNDVPFKLETNYKNYYSLVVDGPLDREFTPQYNISITATDEGSPALSSTSVITVHISDVNDNKPLFTDSIINVYVTENSPVGAVMKTVSAVDADIDQNGQLSYSFLHNPSDSVHLSAIIEAVINNPLKLYRIEITILDVNDNSPSFLSTSQIINITEITSAGAKFPLHSANDADVGKNTVSTYRLSQNEYFTVATHKGETVTPELQLQKVLDREKQSVITLTLTAIDGGTPAKSGSMIIIVNVLDINDNAPVFSQTLYKANVYENVKIGTSIITLNATDLDEGSNGQVFYSFSEVGRGKQTDIFEINEKSGTVTNKKNIDFEQNTAFEIRVQASDGASSPMTSHAKLLIEVLDINDNAPEISVTLLLNTVKEDASIGTAIALVSVFDKDGGKNGMVHSKIANNVPFKLETNYKNYYSLIVNGPLDREFTPQYNISVTATDEGSPALSSTSVITVHISDVNDNKPLFTDGIISVYVKENSPVGAVLKTISAVDADIDQNGHVSYSFLHNPSDSVHLSAMVNINSETGDIVSLQSFNYEETKTFQLFNIITNKMIDSVTIVIRHSLNEIMSDHDVHCSS
uniref:Cadherin domain-containing protein n=1 Tax=Sphaeramia orbicularis TaxID=375764 RepID=A0A672YM43_9TELE